MKRGKQTADTPEWELEGLPGSRSGKEAAAAAKNRVGTLTMEGGGCIPLDPGGRPWDPVTAWTGRGGDGETRISKELIYKAPAGGRLHDLEGQK